MVATLDRPGIQARFERFHRKNPQLLDKLIDLARRMKANGAEWVSVRDLFGHLRVTRSVYNIETTGDYKLNNSFTSRYGRLMVKTAPDLDGFVRLGSMST